ncbi:hypothetical protein XENOCAPTIV_012455, partial [Xenoophorus captivus]
YACDIRVIRLLWERGLGNGPIRLIGQLKEKHIEDWMKRVARPAKGTAQWVTSVGNEMGQVLISGLTAGEGPGLDLMAGGLVDRYVSSAGVDPPVALYVDCGCCKEVSETKLKARFSEWPNLIVRLDTWHFMQRLAVGYTTDAHQLYPTFMARMLACIFEWDAADVNKLRGKEGTA